MTDSSQPAASPDVGITCGFCGGPLYMETCETRNGKKGHHWTLTSECQRCGHREDTQDGCLDCKPADWLYAEADRIL